LYSEYLAKEPLDGHGDLNIGGQIIQTVKYADDFVLMAKEETVLCTTTNFSKLTAALNRVLSIQT
jgi:hypothetical protein